jgi:hypothetical protein
MPTHLFFCNTYYTYAQSSFKKNTPIVFDRLLLKLRRTDLPHFTVKLPLPTRTSKVHFFYVSQAGEIQPDNMLENNIKTVEVRQSFKVNSAYKKTLSLYFQFRLRLLGIQSHREKKRGERKQRESFCPPSWSVHHNFSGDSNSESATVAVSKQDFLDKDAKNSFLVMVYSAQFNIVIEALNLVLEKILSRNPAVWQYHSASLQTTVFCMAWLAI